jgi:hypothetical protein
MHVPFNTQDYDLWLSYYGSQALQTGFGIEGYRGIPYQRGAGLGSFFRSLFRMAIPVIKSVGRNVGKHALAAGANVMSDLVQGRPVIDTVRKHSKAETAKLLREAGEILQEGEGLGFRSKSINTNVHDVFSKQKHVSRRRKINTKH